jgi:glycosyltransferase involved in cell wall biosynthesis
VTALVAARDEEQRIGATVRALLSLEGMTRVVVADDGSEDGTGRVASSAGATVVRSSRSHGKGAALQAALDRTRSEVYLLADGDLGLSASGLAPVLREVLEGRADLAVAVPPRPPTGGFGLVKGTARRCLGRVAGRSPVEPLSGQRAVTRECLQASLPLARGFGVEAGMLADALRLGFRLVEVPASVQHRWTGRDPAGFLHRARQGRDMLRALLPRLAGVR